MTRGRRALDGLDDDMRDHIERETQDNIARGMSPEDARRQALLKFGNVALVKEDTRAVWIWRWLEQLVQDLHHGTRVLIRRPGFTIAATLTLARGTGATATVFSLLDTVLLRSLPVSSPGELAHIYTSCRAGDPFVRARTPSTAITERKAGRSPTWQRFSKSTQVFVPATAVGSVPRYWSRRTTSHCWTSRRMPAS